MLPQIVTQCEYNGDPMTLKIMQCELGIRLIHAHAQFLSLSLNLSLSLSLSLSLNPSLSLSFSLVLSHNIVISCICLLSTINDSSLSY